jgi:hypothetical protein
VPTAAAVAVGALCGSAAIPTSVGMPFEVMSAARAASQLMAA